MSASSEQLRFKPYYIGWLPVKHAKLDKPGMYAITKVAKPGGCPYEIAIRQPDNTILTIPIVDEHGRVHFDGDDHVADGFVELVRDKHGQPAQRGRPETTLGIPAERPSFVIPDDQLSNFDTTFPNGMNALFGSFGAVSRATWSKNDTETKMIVARKYGSGLLGNDMLFKEAHLMATVLVPPHENIVQCFGLTVHQSLCLVLEYCEEYSLDLSMHKLKPAVSTKLKWSRDVATGLAYLHSKGVAHRDLKLPNVMLKSGTAKIGNFGISQITNDPTILASDVKSFGEQIVAELFRLWSGPPGGTFVVEISPGDETETTSAPPAEKKAKMEVAAEEVLDASKLQKLYDLLVACRGGPGVTVPEARQIKNLLPS